MRITYARQVRLDERTDIREEFGATYEDDLFKLTADVASGRAKLTPGLMGWGCATHTLTYPGEHLAYHVAIEPEAQEAVPEPFADD